MPDVTFHDGEVSGREELFCEIRVRRKLLSDNLLHDPDFDHFPVGAECNLPALLKEKDGILHFCEGETFFLGLTLRCLERSFAGWEGQAIIRHLSQVEVIEESIFPSEGGDGGFSMYRGTLKQIIDLLPEHGKGFSVVAITDRRTNRSGTDFLYPLWGRKDEYFFSQFLKSSDLNPLPLKDDEVIPPR